MTFDQSIFYVLMTRGIVFLGFVYHSIVAGCIQSPLSLLSTIFPSISTSPSLYSFMCHPSAYTSFCLLISLSIHQVFFHYVILNYYTFSIHLFMHLFFCPFYNLSLNPSVCCPVIHLPNTCSSRLMTLEMCRHPAVRLC